MNWYSDEMIAPAQMSALDRMLDPVTECLTPEVARRIVELRADSEVQSRIDDLAEKAGEGKLTADERDEYSALIEAIDVIGILQAKARRVLEISPSR